MRLEAAARLKAPGSKWQLQRGGGVLGEGRPLAWAPRRSEVPFTAEGGGAWRNGFREGAECEDLQGNIRGDVRWAVHIPGAQGQTGDSGSEDSRSGNEALAEISEDFCLRSHSPGSSGQAGCQERWKETHHPFSTLSGVSRSHFALWSPLAPMPGITC